LLPILKVQKYAGLDPEEFALETIRGPTIINIPNSLCHSINTR
jgi:hypothetical protein